MGHGQKNQFFYNRYFTTDAKISFTFFTFTTDAKFFFVSIFPRVKLTSNTFFFLKVLNKSFVDACQAVLLTFFSPK